MTVAILKEFTQKIVDQGPPDVVARSLGLEILDLQRPSGVGFELTMPSDNCLLD